MDDQAARSARLSGVRGGSLLAGAALALLAAPSAWPAPAQVLLCHVPPDDPGSAHTIRISEKAVAAHLKNHPGDVLSECVSGCHGDNTACDDNNKCTEDLCLEDGSCQNADVSSQCDDGDACTDDACDPATGCVNRPAPAGQACDDGSSCTGPDSCNDEGTCVGSPIPGCCATDTDCGSSNQCTTFTCDATTQQCTSQPTPCTPSDPCHVAACHLQVGCVQTPKDCTVTVPIDCIVGSCDDASGECVTMVDETDPSCADVDGGLGIPSETVNLGDTVSVPISVSGLGPEIVSAFDLDVLYDPSIIMATNVEFGPYLGDQFSSLTSADLSIPGIADFAELSLLSDSTLLATQPDAFVLATLSFTTVGPGTSTLTVLAHDMLNDIKGLNNDVLDLAVSTDATITVE